MLSCSRLLGLTDIGHLEECCIKAGIGTAENTTVYQVIDDIGTPTVPAEIQVIRIADSVWITAPMEVLAETGLKIKKESPHEHTFIAAISNGYLHYAPPASYYPRGGYEVTECLLAPEWEEIFETAVRGLLAKV